MSFVEDFGTGRQRDCERIAQNIQSIEREVVLAKSELARLHGEIESLESELDALDRNLVNKIMEQGVSIITKGRSRGTPGGKKLDDIKTAADGLELGIRLGNEMSTSTLRDLERGPLELAFQNPPERQHLVDELESKREEISRLEKLIDDGQENLELSRRRFEDRNCLDVLPLGLSRSFGSP